ITYSCHREGNGKFLLRSNEFIKGSGYRLLINPEMEDLCGNSFVKKGNERRIKKIRDIIEIEFDIQ
ncbi:MAG: hypothetical protein AAF616_16295, partial [Bacteroidota bacterium]